MRELALATPDDTGDLCNRSCCRSKCVRRRPIAHLQREFIAERVIEVENGLMQSSSGMGKTPVIALYASACCPSGVLARPLSTDAR